MRPAAGNGPRQHRRASTTTATAGTVEITLVNAFTAGSPPARERARALCAAILQLEATVPERLLHVS